MDSHLLPLLRTKNRCLQRFLALSERFLEQTADGRIESLEAALGPFEAEREAIVRAIGLYERKIGMIAAASATAEQTIDDAFRNDVVGLVGEGEGLLAQILKLDDRVVAAIEGGKQALQAEVQTNERNKSLMRKFKSSWAEGSGEEIDRKL